ncbi:glycosyltransferase family 2 protein [Virgibacillus necropolis]|uniref:Glycosyltransferase 2-like domain-containing protein n=1 Tax=Virgibacillus necropolis TaxID=163877 RepID=A0A221MEB9_9BACI|nr:glycosyltransferase [Virgibacillus necropolis]ASN05984.1 hypothetical protein CFK40_13635 [Virgibacillus necropolis]
MSKVSVIIPIYNPGKNLEKCIKSVLKQTFTDFELILVNDGSTDNSLKICEKYRKTDNRILIIDKKNEGTVVTRRKGLDASSSDYIMFVDSDDWIDKKTIEILYKGAIKDSLEIIVCNTLRTFGNGLIKQKNNSIYFKEDRVFNKEEIKDELAIAYFHGHPFPASLCAKLYKRELLMSSGKYIDKIKFFGEDLFYNLEMLMKADRLKVVDESLYYYRLGGFTSRYMPDLFKDVIEGFKIQKKVIDEHYQNTKQSNYNGPSIMLLNMFKRCLYDLFLGNLTELEIKQQIFEYVSNDYILEAIDNRGSIKFFSDSFLNAIRNKDVNYLFNIGENIYKKKKYKHALMKIASKLAVV